MDIPLCSGRRNDKHWAHCWSDKWYMYISWQWIDAVGSGLQSDTIVFHTWTWTCSKLVFLPAKSNCRFQLLFFSCINLVPLFLYLHLTAVCLFFLQEELEEGAQTTIYDNFKFLTKEELERLRLTKLIGTNLLRAYMHGYFVRYSLYKKVRPPSFIYAYFDQGFNECLEPKWSFTIQ